MHRDTERVGSLWRRHAACHVLALQIGVCLGRRIQAGELYETWRTAVRRNPATLQIPKITRSAQMVAQRKQGSSHDVMPEQEWTPPRDF